MTKTTDAAKNDETYERKLRWARHYLRDHYVTPSQLDRIAMQFETEPDCETCAKDETRETCRSAPTGFPPRADQT